MKRLKAIGAAGGASLIALSLLLVPALAAQSHQGKARPSLHSRPIGAFTPAVSDPRLAGALARRNSGFQTSSRSKAIE